MLGTDLLQTLPEQLLRSVALAYTLRAAFRVRRSLLEPLVERFHVELRLPAPEHVAALVPEDLKEPRPEGAPEVEARQGVVRLDECQLQRVLGVLGIPHHGDGQPEPGGLVRPHQRLVEPGLTGLALANQFELQLTLQLYSFPSPMPVGGDTGRSAIFFTSGLSRATKRRSRTVRRPAHRGPSRH